jgi:predicted chitinase
MLSAESLAEVMGETVSADRYAELYPGVCRAMNKCGCTTVVRAAAWHSQIGHESVGLKYMREIWGPTAQQLTYQGRMGNNEPGDGEKYMGRGPLQVTGKDNYRDLSQWANSMGLVDSPTFFVDDPVQLEGDFYGFTGVVWYWTVQQPSLNLYADAGDIENVSKLVNAPAWVGDPNRHANGIEDRTNRYHQALSMGDDILAPIDVPGHLPDNPFVISDYATASKAIASQFLA